MPVQDIKCSPMNGLCLRSDIFNNVNNISTALCKLKKYTSIRLQIPKSASQEFKSQFSLYHCTDYLINTETKN